MSICMEEDYMQIMRDADEALNRYHAERAAKDAAVLGEVKAMVSTEVFSEIEQELTACESVGEYVIVDDAVGEAEPDIAEQELQHARRWGKARRLRRARDRTDAGADTVRKRELGADDLLQSRERYRTSRVCHIYLRTSSVGCDFGLFPNQW